MKKLLCLLMLLSLFGCNKLPEEPIDKSDEYIKPLNEVNFFNELNDSLKNRLLDIYGEEKVANNLIEMFDKKLTDITVKDYYGNDVNFIDYQNSNIVLEVVQYTCEHCKKQVPLTETIINNEDITFIQYFAFGDNEQIDNFYLESSFAMPNGLIVIPQNDALSSYISELGVDSTPTFLFFNESVLTFACTGELSYAKYLKASKLAYDNPIGKDEFVNNDGNSVFDNYRSYDDVLNDLSTNNKDMFAKIENSEELTVNVIGSAVLFNELYEQEKDVLYSIDSYAKYINKPLVVFYIGNVHDNLADDIKIINDFASNHEDLNILTILIDNKDLKTSPLYKQINFPLNTDVISSNAEIPKKLLDTKVTSYPAALFIQDNIFTGGCHSIADIDTIELAYNTFIGDDSLALKINN